LPLNRHLDAEHLRSRPIQTLVHAEIAAEKRDIPGIWFEFGSFTEQIPLARILL
jgi:hypothetical protein